jgi:hypothetical protein
MGKKWYLEYIKNGLGNNVVANSVLLEATSEAGAIEEARRKWPDIEASTKGWRPQVVYRIDLIM